MYVGRGEGRLAFPGGYMENPEGGRQLVEWLWNDSLVRRGMCRVKVCQGVVASPPFPASLVPPSLRQYEENEQIAVT